MGEIRVVPMGWIVRQRFGGFWGKYMRINFPELASNLEKNYSLISTLVDQEGILVSSELYSEISKICDDFKIIDKSLKDTLCLVVEVMRSSLEYQKKNEVAKTALGFKSHMSQIKGLRTFLDSNIHKSKIDGSKRFLGEYVEIRYKNTPFQAPEELGERILDVIKQYTVEKEEYYSDELTWKAGQWESLYAFDQNSDKEIMRFRKYLMKDVLSFLNYLENGETFGYFKPLILSPVKMDLFIGRLFVIAGVLPEITSDDIPKRLKKQGKSPYPPQERLLQQRVSTLRNNVINMFKLKRSKN